MMKINSKMGKRLSFSMLIENTNKQPEAKFTIVCDNGEHLSFPCSLKEEKINASIPELIQYRHMLKEETHRAFLEIMVDDSYFKPWEGDVVVEWPVAVKMFNDIEEEDINESQKPEAELIIGKDEAEPKIEEKLEEEKQDEKPDLQINESDTKPKIAVSEIFEKTLQED